MKHLLSVDDLSGEDIDIIFYKASNIEHQMLHKEPRQPIDFVVASFFAEPSTRTRFSFERAVHWLGGKIITAADASASSSISKGESLKDTFRTLGQYADSIVFRHKDESWPEVAQKYSRVPVINAGSGGKEHPTQALLDLYTIQKEIGDVTGKSIMFCGDLMFGRTVHSLIKLLVRYNCKIFLCPAAVVTNNAPVYYLDLPVYYTSEGSVSVSLETAKKMLPSMDAVYMTRIQKERFSSGDSTINSLKLDKSSIDTMKSSSAILHPLPRNEEIAEEVDDDPRASYHERQVRNGLYIRIALMEYLLELR